MKLSKDTILKLNLISKSDADFRLAEFKRYKTFEPDSAHYPFESMKAIWPEGEYFDYKNIEGFCGDFLDGFYIMFRGTDSLWGWITNFMFSKKVIPYEGTNPKIKVHNGFLKDYLVIRDFVHKKIKETDKEKIYVHGHSKGAALTVLCALDIQYNFPEKEIGSFGIGTPKIGNEEFVRSFNGRLPDFINIENGSDLIPQIPPRFFGYRHVENKIHIGKERRCCIGTHKDHNWQKYYDNMEKDLVDRPYP